MTESTALVSLEEQLKRELQNLGKQVDPPSSNKISTKGKLFKVPGGQSGPGPLSVIVMDFIGVNMFYPGVYNPNVKAPPACFSLGKNLEAMVPSESIKTPQHTDCNTCPKNKWGSGPNGAGKACKNQRRLLVLPANFDDKTEPMTLYVSPTGLKAWNAYVKRVARELAAIPAQVITEISFDPQQSYPTLMFDCKGKHANLELVWKLRERHNDMLLREPDAQAA